MFSTHHHCHRLQQRNCYRQILCSGHILRSTPNHAFCTSILECYTHFYSCIAAPSRGYPLQEAIHGYWNNLVFLQFPTPFFWINFFAVPLFYLTEDSKAVVFCRCRRGQKVAGLNSGSRCLAGLGPMVDAASISEFCKGIIFSEHIGVSCATYSSTKHHNGIVLCC